MPASAPSASSVHQGAQAFIEREERQRQAIAQQEEAQATATSARPDWMLTMPSSNDQRSVTPGTLRARGFQQATSRAWRAVPDDPSEARRLWTETPEQKRQRMQKGAVSADPARERDELEKERVAARDAALHEQVRAQNTGRSRSLLDEHKRRRLEELREKESRSHNKREHRHHHHRSHRHERRSRRDDRDRSRSPPVRKTRAQREEEDRLQHGEYAAPLFDKDKVLGKGSRLMDERARSRSIADAAQLSSRFATGSSGAFL